MLAATVAQDQICRNVAHDDGPCSKAGVRGGKRLRRRGAPLLRRPTPIGAFSIHPVERVPMLS
jgi:hypothetical protein